MNHRCRKVVRRLGADSQHHGNDDNRLAICWWVMNADRVAIAQDFNYWGITSKSDWECLADRGVPTFSVSYLENMNAGTKNVGTPRNC
ncbi:hypothetical protein ACQ4M3_23480 [Leptolyngbya sp. AN03gr2]|uniref:hypothetical protein n=1 Tax=unclassified Leptolyngbya TaxID=2650499 RepID=UPI003D3128F3